MFASEGVKIRWRLWLAGSKAIVAKEGRKLRDRDPPGPNEGGPGGSSQPWRSQSGRWGSIGGRRKEELTEHFRQTGKVGKGKGKGHSKGKGHGKGKSHSKGKGKNKGQKRSDN